MRMFMRHKRMLVVMVAAVLPVHMDVRMGMGVFMGMHQLPVAMLMGVGMAVLVGVL